MLLLIVLKANANQRYTERSSGDATPWRSKPSHSYLQNMQLVQRIELTSIRVSSAA
jgi:hypothetical protein